MVPMSSTQPEGGAPRTPEVEARLLAYLDRTTDLVGVTDDKGNVVYLNDTARARLHVPAGVEGPLTTVDLFPPEAFDTYFEQMRPAILRGDVWNGYLPVVVGAGEPVEMWVTVVGGVRPGGEVAWLVLTARDVTEWRHVRDELSQGATHDALTGLANRTVLHDRMGIALTRARRTGAKVAVLVIDVDDLGVVNDSFGLVAGDAVLVELAGRLNDSVRAIDTVARVGGDEFVVLLDGVDDEDEARSLATRVQAVLEARSIEAAPGTIVNVSASVGMAVGDGEVEAEALLRRADAAMYDAKGERHPERRRTPGTRDVSPAVTAHDVAVALTQRAIVPYYQPVVVAGTGAVAAMQVLARWLRPEGDPVAAHDFVEIVEGSGVSFSLDLAMLRQAVVDVASRPDLHVPRVDVPVAARFLLRPGVERFVHEVLSQARLPASRLAVVVPERLLAHHSRLVADALWSLHEEGVTLVASVPELEPGSLPQLDDGLFAELRFPASGDLDALVAFARGRGMVPRVFGVESTDALAQAVAAGCELAEGRAIGDPRPMPDGHGADTEPALG